MNSHITVLLLAAVAEAEYDRRTDLEGARILLTTRVDSARLDVLGDDQ